MNLIHSVSYQTIYALNLLFFQATSSVPGQGLLNFFLRGINCGAFTEEEAARAGLTVEELRSRSFLTILNRRARR